MSVPKDTEQSLLADITQARLTTGLRGKALDTQAALTFALDHARAREAVMSELDVARIGTDLDATGLSYMTVASAAQSRDHYVKRPDLGRTLIPTDKDQLAKHDGSDIALVLADGLSAIAVALNGAAFMTALCARLKTAKITHGPVILARQARVALGDDIAAATGAQTVIMALGERPGLSAADSLGVYITHRPHADWHNPTPDSARICISNIRTAGLSIDEAVAQTEHILLAMRQTGLTGVALNQVLATNALPKGTRA